MDLFCYEWAEDQWSCWLESYCVNYLLLHNKSLQNLATSHNTNFLSLSLCGSGVQAQLSRFSHKAAVKLLARTIVISRLNWGSIHFWAHSCGCWEDSAPCGLLDWILLLSRDHPPFLATWPLPVGQFTSSMCLSRKGNGERVSARWINSLLEPNQWSDFPSLLLYFVP